MVASASGVAGRHGDLICAEADARPKDARAAPEAMGHIFADNADNRGVYWGDAEGILIEPTSGDRLGASDPRSPDAQAAGY